MERGGGMSVEIVVVVFLGGGDGMLTLRYVQRGNIVMDM